MKKTILVLCMLSLFVLSMMACGTTKLDKKITASPISFNVSNNWIEDVPNTAETYLYDNIIFAKDYSIIDLDNKKTKGTIQVTIKDFSNDDFFNDKTDSDIPYYYVGKLLEYYPNSKVNSISLNNIDAVQLEIKDEEDYEFTPIITYFAKDKLLYTFELLSYPKNSFIETALIKTELKDAYNKLLNSIEFE